MKESGAGRAKSVSAKYYLLNEKFDDYLGAKEPIRYTMDETPQWNPIINSLIMCEMIFRNQYNRETKFIEHISTNLDAPSKIV